ncbi:hypothetical protein [Nocardia sp. NPDC004415]
MHVDITTDAARFLTVVPAPGIPAVADALSALDGPLTCVEGPAASVDAFLARWSATTGGTHHPDYTARLYALNTPHQPTAPGEPRPATAADLAWCLRMTQEFAAETESSRSISRAVAERQIEAGMWSSNKIYRAIGFEAVCDFVNHRLVPASA